MGGRIETLRGKWVRRARRLTAGVLALALLAGAGSPARAEERSLAEQLGLGLVAGVGSLVYFPVKLAYSFLGGLVGGLTYVVTLGDEETANAVWEPTLGGSYLITPDIVAGDEPLEFVGGSEQGKEDKQSKGQWD